VRRARISPLASLCPLAFLTLAGCGSGDSTVASLDDAADTGALFDAADSSTDADASLCPHLVLVDPAVAKRASCTFAAGARVADTLGLTSEQRGRLPITHVVIVMQENRAFDHYFGKLPASGKLDVEGIAAVFTNPDKAGVDVAPYHLPNGCLPADPPHQGAAMKAAWDSGKMDGFVKSAAVSPSDGHFVMGYYDETDLPFYYFLAKTFALSDSYFGAALAGTWANRDYLYAATSDGVTDTGQRVITKPTIFDALDGAKVTWGVYTDGNPRQDSLGWTSTHVGVHKYPAFLAALKDGSLPQVVFLDPGGGQDEHPPADVHGGEAWEREIYQAAIASPLWKELAIVFTYDESGGLADHVPPPKACLASADQSAFDRHGIRVPMMLVSPWARAGFVSHVVHDHTSVTRLVEALFDLPALTGRDANADALFDMFDFDGCPALLAPPTAPAAGALGCK
jgi:phospholipase C